jgi:hypothetical protein
LTEETYIKTKGYKSQRIKKKLKRPESMKRTENDVTLNYAAAEFKFEE